MEGGEKVWDWEYGMVAPLFRGRAAGGSADEGALRDGYNGVVGSGAFAAAAADNSAGRVVSVVVPTAGACSHMLLMWSCEVLFAEPFDQGVEVPFGEAS